MSPFTPTRCRVIRAAARATRQLHGRGFLPDKASGGVRLLARRFASSGRYVYRDYYGHVVEADLADYMERIGFFGAHSSRLLQHITSLLRPGDWVIDAGANVGLFASAMCKAVGPTGCVWAIEPLPQNVAKLHSLKEANGLDQLAVFPIALASSASVARLRLPAAPGGSGFGSFVATWESAGDIEVPTIRLDDLVTAKGPERPLRVVKIDVEGFESELLAGAGRTITERRPLILCEFHDPLLRAAGSSSDQLLEQFGRYGYAPKAPFAPPAGPLEGAILDLLLASEHPVTAPPQP